MSTVHVFSSIHSFGSFEALRVFVDPTYTKDGDIVPSDFMREVDLISYEPMCIEVIYNSEVQFLRDLLEGVSYGKQWINEVESSLTANEAICVFEPNIVARSSSASSVTYCGSFQYDDSE